MENNKMRILAVDDNIINLATIEQELKDKYEVVTVNSGARAIRFLNKEKPDLILLDVQMALMDGIETLKEIRTMEGGALIPVIMLTSKKDRETVIEGTKLGIMDYVLKPFDSQDLHARIDRALKKVGVLPVEDKELYENVKDVQTELQGGSLRNALLKMEEILSFKIDEEIFGRIQNAKARLRANDEKTAERLINRVMKMLERTVATETEAKFPISAGEMNARLLYVLNDLQNFKVKEASQKLEDLMRYDIPEAVGKICASAQERLDEFDDEAAEELIQKALAEMKNNLI
ncbi:MAG: response regulator [Lachnospiraceae bacterium]|jgi:DNA-binding response OmpR family regulator|nr:response regulator [Lachnospiraceae bacterium]MCX4308458.1 response regulator [Acetatifactor sp.]